MMMLLLTLLGLSLMSYQSMIRLQLQTTKRDHPCLREMSKMQLQLLLLLLLQLLLLPSECEKSSKAPRHTDIQLVFS